jgi:nucleotide-binding universal stress UspA family protein
VATLANTTNPSGTVKLNGRKAIWAVDPFAKNKKLQIHVAKGLEKLLRGSDVSIEPVAVLSPDQLRIPVKAFAGQNKEYKLEAEERLHALCEESKIKTLLAPTLLVQDSLSVRASVDTLLKYAKDTSAEVIATGTTTKTGLARFLVGSYAESLILRANLPVYVVGPKAKVDAQISKILFPTDFSEKSYTAFLKLGQTAKARKAQVFLYYKVEYAVPPAVYGFDPLPVYQEYWKQEVEQKKQTSKRWLKAATDSGIKAKAVFDEKSGFVAESVLSAARKNGCQVIAMASESGAVAASFLGSVSRQVVRSATIPVWIIHP